MWFELINEPNGQLKDSNLMAVLTPLRWRGGASNLTRPGCAVPADRTGRGDRIAGDRSIPERSWKIVATFHYYDLFEFTHQGAT